METSVSIDDIHIYPQDHNINNDIWFWRLAVLLMLMIIYLLLEKICDDITKDRKRKIR